VDRAFGAVSSSLHMIDAAQASGEQVGHTGGVVGAIYLGRDGWCPEGCAVCVLGGGVLASAS
jgi:hypothetical protein